MQSNFKVGILRKIHVQSNMNTVKFFATLSNNFNVHTYLWIIMLSREKADPVGEWPPERESFDEITEDTNEDNARLQWICFCLKSTNSKKIVSIQSWFNWYIFKLSKYYNTEEFRCHTMHDKCHVNRKTFKVKSRNSSSLIWQHVCEVTRPF